MLPVGVAQAAQFAAELDFAQSCDPDVGRLLSVLAAAVPINGRILKIGTGAGVGLAWILEGVGARSDVEIVTIDNDAELSARVAAQQRPSTVQFQAGDALTVVPRLGQFDFVFADAVAGKWFGLDVSLAATVRGGIFLVDDMTPLEWASEEHELKTQEVRTRLMSDDRLASVELACGSGAILSVLRST